jgi:hypothetical protein
MENTLSWSYCYGEFEILHRDWTTRQKVCTNVVVRTLIIAAGQQDSKEDARLIRGSWFKLRDEQSNIFLVVGAYDAWVLQLGRFDLFARGIQAWAEDEEL